MTSTPRPDRIPGVEGFRVVIRLYAECVRKAGGLVASNWGVLFTLYFYALSLAISAIFLAPFGFAGGMVHFLIRAACFSSVLYLVDTLLRTSRVTLEDFKGSFTPYLGDAATAMFCIFGIQWITSMVTAGSPQGRGIALFVDLVIFVLFNAVPEIIHSTRRNGLEVYGESFNFVVENWIEWLPPNLLMMGLGWWLLFEMPDVVPFGSWLDLLLLPLLFYFVMVFRGLLFGVLHGSNRRGRIYRAGFED